MVFKASVALQTRRIDKISNHMQTCARAKNVYLFGEYAKHCCWNAFSFASERTSVGKWFLTSNLFTTCPINYRFYWKVSWCKQKVKYKVERWFKIEQWTESVFSFEMIEKSIRLKKYSDGSSSEREWKWEPKQFLEFATKVWQVFFIIITKDAVSSFFFELFLNHRVYEWIQRSKRRNRNSLADFRCVDVLSQIRQANWKPNVRP